MERLSIRSVKLAFPRARRASSFGWKREREQRPLLHNRDTASSGQASSSTMRSKVFLVEMLRFLEKAVGGRSLFLDHGKVRRPTRLNRPWRETGICSTACPLLHFHGSSLVGSLSINKSKASALNGLEASDRIPPFDKL